MCERERECKKCYTWLNFSSDARDVPLDHKDLDDPPATHAMPRPTPTPCRSWAVVRRWWVVEILVVEWDVPEGTLWGRALTGWHHVFEHEAMEEMVRYQSGAHARGAEDVPRPRGMVLMCSMLTCPQ